MSDEPVPLFPLNSVLVPGLVFPLHIFEPRYRRLVEDLQELPEEQRVFGVVAIRQGREVGEDGARALFDVGTLAQMRTVTPLDHGCYDIVTVGTERFRISEVYRGFVEGPYPRPVYHRARVEPIEEDPGHDAQTQAAAVRHHFTEYRTLIGAAEVGDLPTEPGVLSYLVAAALVTDLPSRQALLEIPDDATRLRTEAALLRRECALIRALPSLPAVDLAATAVSLN